MASSLLPAPAIHHPAPKPKPFSTPRLEELIFNMSYTVVNYKVIFLDFKLSPHSERCLLFLFHRFTVHFDSVSFFTPTYALSHTTKY
jgi:hypothetical protein